jgi:uncharacterized membrane protein YdfJ with MMPL/SSD domain
MWISVLAMAIAVSLEPFRIGMTVLMLNRPRPALQLLASLTGGFVMAATVGVVVLFLFRPVLSRFAQFRLPNVQIVIGVLALLIAALLRVGVMPAPKLPTRARRIGQVGTTIGLGLLFDTLVVRSFMTPSVATLLGKWFWWPQHVRRRPVPVPWPKPIQRQPQESVL